MLVETEVAVSERKVGMTERRAEIAEAGIRILAARGVRAFTHLGIDRELGLPDGSTSYYARSRNDLINLVVEHLAARSSDELTAQTIPAELTPPIVASLVVAGLDTAMQRADDHSARLVLLLECRNNPEIRKELVTRPQVRSSFIAMATTMLRRLGIKHPAEHAHDFASLVDGMLMQRILRAAPSNEAAIVTAYLDGLLARRS